MVTNGTVPTSKQEDPTLIERIANLSIEPNAEPVLVPFTAEDVELWKEFLKYRKLREGWTDWRVKEWGSHHPPHVHLLFNNWPILKTPRLRLRLLGPDDLDASFRIMSDETAMKYYGIPVHTDPEHTRTNYVDMFIQRFERRDAASLAIILTEGKEANGDFAEEYIGNVNISAFDRDFRYADIAYILDRKYWGKGFATEAVGRVVDFLLKDMKIHKVRAICFVENVASRRVLEKCGFKEEGYLRDNSLVDGEYADEYLMGIIGSDLDSEAKGSKEQINNS
jgi:[ribosomal protein S5]-alanine N-acetyltransferase